MPSAVIHTFGFPAGQKVRELVTDWRGDSFRFLHQDAPKILLILIVALVVIRIVHTLTRGMVALRARHLPPGIRGQQIQTLASVINSIASFVVWFLVGLTVLDRVGINLGPLLASAGIAGLAIGFGAQTLVKDFINGFFVLLEDQYNIGDGVRLAGVKGTVEDMSLRRTVLRDDDGTVHVIPNSQVQIVSNMTRDWSQIALQVSVAYGEPSDKIIELLKQVGEEIRHDPQFADDIVADIQVPGIDRVGNGEAEYLVLVKTRPRKQFTVTREFRRRIKECFEKNKIQAGLPGRVFVTAQPASN
ncbi:MAG TPA: mechanosensitive ion channel family protein [Terriglobales bacterium]|jgi:moderate conductance mechanosensitive channel|nr:mechanosensitive ion channel family protein [Terriglobales bacterium]